eukprot:2260319-Pyramimonas_sp.AAC.1
MSAPQPMSKASAPSRRGGHHGVWWACSQQAVSHLLRGPCQPPMDSDRGLAAHDPDLAPKCMMHYCF